MKFGIVTFPGSNCDYDTFEAVTTSLGEEAVMLWHKEHSLQDADVVILPGGFSYGDYLRAGAIARFSPIMQEVIEHARRGGPVLGICNGFQIACEAGLLPGALLRNANLQFIHETSRLRVDNNTSQFTNQYRIGEILRIPMAHGDGRYTADTDTLARLEGEGRIAFRYVTAAGEAGAMACASGSSGGIAGILNDEGNVLGMMPHPERAVEKSLGSADGLRVFESLLAAVNA
jgi:phosphoribosylformylglycinamidine synthase subunit PurQ / glutaminase